MSLPAHCRASGAAARALLEGPLASLSPMLGDGLGLEAGEAARLAAVLVGLHDLGKATPGFQSAWDEGAERARAAGFPFAKSLVRTPHAFVSAGELARWLESRGIVPLVARRLGHAVGAHHGRFPDAHLALADDGADPDGRWQVARKALIQEICAEFAAGRLPRPSRATDAAVAILAGLTTFADWLASDRSVLGRLAADGLDPDAVAQAITAVPLIGVPEVPQRAFEELFPFAPRGSQVVIDRTVAPAVEAGTPMLTIVEDATGAGKTEAAFQILRAALRAGARGAYVALPTRATSNQAYRRLAAFLARTVPGVSQAHLLHSGALLTGDYAAIRAGRHPLSPRGIDADDQGEEAGAVEASQWFCQSKRGLLSTFAVGTIDQAMLAVLRARFATLRLTGLAAKTLVLDEVHAYDTYMSSVIERLVAWAGALGCNVVLLSATLPTATKQRLAAAYTDAGTALSDVELASYPSVTTIERDRPARTFAVAPAAHGRRRVGLERVALTDAEAPAAACRTTLETAVCAGANVALVLNTVARAQEAYRALSAHLPGVPIRLLHSRFRMAEREAIERALVEDYGPDGPRPTGSLVIGTQVIEQSLDVDFDLLVSDLAPVDLLLQRMGRLQRHDRRGRRPAGYDESSCRLALLEPPTDGGVPAFDAGTSRVYDPHVLLRTAVALAGRSHVHVPDDVRALIEAVYADQPPPQGASEQLLAAWRTTAGALRLSLAREYTMAANRVIGAPGDETIQDDLAEIVGDDVDPAPGSLAQTRRGVSCPLVVLRAAEASRLADADPRVPSVARALLERALTLSHPGLAGELRARPVPAHWRRAPLLANHRLIVLDEDDRHRLGRAELVLDDSLGLVIDWSEA